MFSRRFDAVSLLELLDENFERFEAIIERRDCFEHMSAIEVMPKKLFKVERLEMFLRLF
jgi:hypothetical protein